MFKYLVSQNGDLSIFGIVSLVIFFLIFVGVLFWAILGRKSYMTKMGQLPLED
ncbi:MAG: hypothetical protein H8D46_00270 [FCB group bacterium]|nr:hypothetical protein [FCB group bacterium]